MNLDAIIDKYNAKLDYLDKALEEVSDLIDPDTLETMQDMRTIITEVISDFESLKA